MSFLTTISIWQPTLATVPDGLQPADIFGLQIRQIIVPFIQCSLVISGTIAALYFLGVGMLVAFERPFMSSAGLLPRRWRLGPESRHRSAGQTVSAYKSRRSSSSRGTAVVLAHTVRPMPVLKIILFTLFGLLTTSIPGRAQPVANSPLTGQFMVVGVRTTAAGSAYPAYHYVMVTVTPDDTLPPTPRLLRPLPVGRIKASPEWAAPEWAVYEPVSPPRFELGIPFFRPGQPQPDGKMGPDRLWLGPAIRSGYDR